jgi:hypothetical protein
MKSASWSFEAVFWLLHADSEMYFGIRVRIVSGWRFNWGSLAYNLEW